MNEIQNDDSVVLLHGLARTESSMEKLGSALRRESFLVVNSGYPSRKKRIEELAASVIPEAIQKCGDAKNIHFVTHSLGGILLREYLSKTKIDRLGRVVMLGPPNKGSQVVDKLKSFPGFRLLNGPAGDQLGTNSDSVPNQLGPVDFELGVIAGNRSINIFLSTLLSGPNDGKVSVESTKVKGMSQHLTVPVSHPFMMKNNTVIGHVLHFLKFGSFKVARDI